MVFSGVVNDYNILGDPGAVSRVGRKGSTKGTREKLYADWAQQYKAFFVPMQSGAGIRLNFWK